MGDNGELNQEPKKEAQEQKPIQLIINFYPNGKINLAGPIHDRILCYGLLEIAKEIIYDLKNAQKKIEVPKGSLINFLRNKQ